MSPTMDNRGSLTMAGGLSNPGLDCRKNLGVSPCTDNRGLTRELSPKMNSRGLGFTELNETIKIRDVGMNRDRSPRDKTQGIGPGSGAIRNTSSALLPRGLGAQRDTSPLPG